MYFAGSAFPDSQVGQFVINNCSQFGFIIRYPKGAEDITGFSYEPWHIRYVGLPHSEIITTAGITLEEYIDLFEIGSWYSFDNCYIARLPEDDLMIPEELTGYEITVSPDNTGYVFVTVYT
jgi:D-alanyl-D-alanine carboxypeptidase